ncbi:MAG: CAP domain-containing protein [Actinomycetota bacterium]|nr:CAP domain-containing protein [Actinomycetota bacterium]
MAAALLRRPFALLVVLCSLFALVGIAMPGRAEAFAYGAAGRVNSNEAALLSYVNSARGAAGLGGLTSAAGATDVARRWSATMAGSGQLVHNPNLLSQIAAAGSSNWRALSENVGYATACDAKQLFDAYMASAPHRANILDPSMHYIGIGTYERPTPGWPCGLAWNTMVFVDSYSTSYGASRNPPQGMYAERTLVTTTRSLATFETGSDTRMMTAVAGTGLVVGHQSIDAPAVGRDDALHWGVRQTSPSGAAWGSLYLRDSLDLRYVRVLRITLQAVTPTKRGLPVGITIYQDWGHAATIGTVTLTGVPRTFLFTVPASVRAFDNNIRLTMSNSSLSAVSPSLSLRTAWISVYDIGLIV